MNPIVLAVILAPIPWLAFILLCRALWGFWNNYLVGTKGFNVIPLALIAIGLGWVRPKYCKVMRYEGRLWVSPHGKRYEIDPLFETDGKA